MICEFNPPAPLASLISLGLAKGEKPSFTYALWLSDRTIRGRQRAKLNNFYSLQPFTVLRFPFTLRLFQAKKKRYDF
jgi:hypothetical protein